ncbi:MAG TPA: ribosome recycling factor [Candidatus Saccharimonadales bacterium]|nr:ribosome recycling factor [Candidatus Saccharimonadales bacterium]
MEETISEAKKKMQASIEHLLSELLSVRSGRAAPSLLEGVKASAYGNQMTLKELASISAPEPRSLIVQPWDQGNVDAIAKAIREAGMGFNPIVESNLIRVAVPALTEERRADLIKLVSEKGEAARVSIRSARRDAIESIDKAEKGGKLSKDDSHRFREQVQKTTDEMISEVDKVVRAKETELKEI